MNDDAGRALVVVLALLLLCTPVIAVAGASTPSAGVSTSTVTTVAEDGTDGNETPRHQHPDEYTEDGDLERIESWLSDRLSSQLQESTISLSQGEYDLARNLVGEEYQNRLGQYIEVAGETQTDSTDGDTNDTAEAFEEAAENQEAFANQTEEYQATKAEYETAREEGDDERARELARELEALATDVDTVGEELIVNYEVITFGTDEDLSASADAINETKTDILDEQAIIREEQFIETELHLETADETVSFLEPLVASGEVRAADGSPIEADDVELRVDGDPTDVETDSDGSIAFEYRPTDQPLSAETITVEYVPAQQSPYLGSETTLNTSLEQVDPTISNLESTDEVAYGDSLAVEGELTVADIPVDDVALEVTLDDEILGELTVTDGTISGSVPVPANVSDGEHMLRVSLPFDNQAIAGATAETPITVEETETDLTIDATETDENELHVNGSLETAAGEGAGGQPVDVQIDGNIVATITTDSTGEFSEIVAVPSAANSDLNVVAQYDGTGTNLASSATETTVSLGPAESTTASSVPSWVFLGGLVVLVVGGVGIWWWRYRYGTVHDQTESNPKPADDSPMASDNADTFDLVDTLLSQASDHLSNGRTESAVKSCYAAVRHKYGVNEETPATLTHWEFYHRHGQDTDTDETSNQLRSVVSEYERAAFAPESVSDSAAKRALESTRQLCGAVDQSTSDTRSRAD